MPLAFLCVTLESWEWPGYEAVAKTDDMMAKLKATPLFLVASQRPVLRPLSHSPVVHGPENAGVTPPVVGACRPGP